MKPINYIFVKPIHYTVMCITTLVVVQPLKVVRFSCDIIGNIVTKILVHVEGKNGLVSVDTTSQCTICNKLMACCHANYPCGCLACFSCIMDWAKKNRNCFNCCGNLNVNKVLEISYIDEEVKKKILDPNVLTSVKADWEFRLLEGLELKKSATFTSPLLRRDLNVSESLTQPAYIRRHSNSIYNVDRDQGAIFITPLLCNSPLPKVDCSMSLEEQFLPCNIIEEVSISEIKEHSHEESPESNHYALVRCAIETVDHKISLLAECEKTVIPFVVSIHSLDRTLGKELPHPPSNDPFTTMNIEPQPLFTFNAELNKIRDLHTFGLKDESDAEPQLDLYQEFNEDIQKELTQPASVAQTESVQINVHSIVEYEHYEVLLSPGIELKDRVLLSVSTEFNCVIVDLPISKLELDEEPKMDLYEELNEELHEDPHQPTLMTYFTSMDSLDSTLSKESLPGGRIAHSLEIKFSWNAPMQPKEIPQLKQV